MDRFFEINISMKEQFLQDEHRVILDVLYKDAVSKDCVINYAYRCEHNCFMASSELESKSKLTCHVFNTCISDLESLGFAMNSMRDPYKEVTYSITNLGLKYLEKHAV